MTKHFNYLIALFILIVPISSCNIDDDEDIELQTTVKIKVIDGTDNSSVPNFTVYAIGAQEWNLMGSSATTVAKAQVVTDNDGEAFFQVGDFSGAFIGNNSQATYYFVVLYTRGADDFYAYKGITFQEGDQKIEIITLD